VPSFESGPEDGSGDLGALASRSGTDSTAYLPGVPVEPFAFIGGETSHGGRKRMPYYECPKCGGGYVIDVPPSARPVCDRDGARLKKASDASYERNARRD
jgi:hypothetical protein